MTSPSLPRDDPRAARALGLKPPVYAHLRDSLRAGEDPVWLRWADPRLAGTFPNPFGFELLLERLAAEESLERRRLNLLRALAEKGRPEVEAAVADARDEGELEDLSLALEPSRPPEGWEPPSKPEHAAFLDSLRGNVGLARDLRRFFREKAVATVELNSGKGADARSFRQFEGMREPLLHLPVQKYFQLRRGERLHVLKLKFELPAGDLRTFFDRSVEGVPPQEKDGYQKLFFEFFQRERQGRYVQEARARLKRNAENVTLQHAWEQLQNALDRGRHEGQVLGLCVLRGNRLVAGLIREDGHLLRTRVLPARGDGLPDRMKEFLGDAKPSLVAIQSDPVTRGIVPPILQVLRAEGGRVRSASVPLAVVKTLLREVARRPDETHLTHDERQALLLARLARTPRAAAFHTPHIVRAYIPGRSEINARRLEEFERTFLRNLLLQRGVDANHAPPDQLRLVPGLDAEGLVRERSTAPFRSLEDFQARMGLPPGAWRAACCFLRVHDSDQSLDSRPVHPAYYPVLETLAAKAGLTGQDLMKDPSRVKEFDWEPLLKEKGWPAGVVDQLRIHLGRSQRRPRKSHKGREGLRLETLEVGAVLRGTVSALLPYGAFVDVGARREGLVHISEMADRFVNDPADVVQVGQEVTVRVLSIDVEHQRFRLSMRQGEAREGSRGEGRDSGPAKKSGDSGSPKRARPQGGRSPAPDTGRAAERGRRDSREARETRPRRERPKRGRVHSRGDEFDPFPRDGKRVRKDPDFNLDPRKEGEEIDPNNPFFKFFQKNKAVVREEKEEKKEKDGTPSN